MSDWCWKPTRLAIYSRDGWQCRSCDEYVVISRRSLSRLSLDHVVPRSKGGTNEPQNLVTLCHDCNSYKQDIDPEEWFVETSLRYRSLLNLLQRPLDMEKGRQLCEEIYPGWLARRKAAGQRYATARVQRDRERARRDAAIARGCEPTCVGACARCTPARLLPRTRTRGFDMTAPNLVYRGAARAKRVGGVVVEDGYIKDGILYDASGNSLF